LIPAGTGYNMFRNMEYEVDGEMAQTPPKVSETAL